jgi:DNA-directed RNA polymerase specialized sigma24 family protein
LWVDDVRRAFRGREVPLDSRDLQSKSPSIERVLADRDDLGEALDALSPEERYVLVSFKVDGRGYSELAGRLGKSVDAVKKMASRAMQRIGGAQRSDMALPAKR